MPTERSEEIRARRTLKRRGLFLNKSRRRDPQAVDFNTYLICDERGLVFPSNGCATLEEIIEWIDTPAEEKKPSKVAKGKGKS